MQSGKNKSNPAPATVSLWWLRPFWIVTVPVVVLSLGAYLLPESEYQENWKTAKAFGTSDLLLCFAVAAAFSAGSLFASWINAGFSIHRPFAQGPRDAGIGQRQLKLLFTIAFFVTLAGYAILFGSIVRQSGIGVFTSMLLGEKGAPYVLKDAAKDSIITGVTTLTQLGIGTALLGTYLGFTLGWRKVWLPLSLLLGLTAMRAVFLSERLSLIEVVLPSGVLLIRLVGCGRPGSTLRRLLVVAPLMGITCLFALFTTTEYFRSWSSFYSGRGEQSLLSFSMLRLVGYYVTALNNGAILWNANGALNFPYATLDWLWRFPVVGGTLQAILGGKSGQVDVDLMTIKEIANPEFNNLSGIFVVFMDLGVPYALIIFAAYGCMAKFLYCSWCRGSMAGLFLYSFLFVSMSEQVRIFYISTGRAFPTWILLFAAVLLTRPAIRSRVFARPSHPVSGPALAP